MTWTLTGSNGNGKEFHIGQLLLLKSTMENSEYAKYFIFMGSAGRFMKLRQARYDKSKNTIEADEEITILSSQRGEFCKVLGLVAEPM